MARWGGVACPNRVPHAKRTLTHPLPRQVTLASPFWTVGREVLPHFPRALAASRWGVFPAADSHPAAFCAADRT